MRNWVCLFGLLAAAFASADDPIKITTAPVFEGLIPNGRTAIRVTLTNRGPSVSGVLSAPSGADQIHYPVDLPTGSTKTLMTYPTIEWGRGAFTFDAPRIHLESDQAPMAGMQAQMSIVFVSDQSGVGNFLVQAKDEKSKNAMFSVGTVRAEDAPDRSSGYLNITAVALGDGAERLSNDSVDALKRYVVAGGTLIFFGGASATVLTDPRWQSVVPIRNIVRRTRPASGIWTRLSNKPFSGMLTVTEGNPVAGARVRHTDDGRPVIVDRPIGFGRTVFLGVNLLERPMSDWEGRSGVFMRLVSQSESAAAHAFLTESMTSEFDDRVQMYSGMRATAPNVTGVRHAIATSPTDPFTFQLPPTDRIFTILGIYFIVVIPVNFLVLRKLKRGELAWFTAPVISLVFAGILFQSARTLYAYETSTVDSGVILGHEAAPGRTYYGESQMFMARSGSYDLHVPNAESIGLAENNPYGYTRRGAPSLDITDDGRHVTIPNLSVTNLAFRKFSLISKVPESDTPSLEVRRLRGSTYRVSIHNTTKRNLSQANVYSGWSILTVGAIAPGATVTRDVKISHTDGVIPSDDIQALTNRSGQIAVVAQIDGLRPGANVGAQVAERSSVNWLQFADLASADVTR